jgi:hypothetical protein
MEVYIYTFVTSMLYGDACWVSGSGSFIPSIHYVSMGGLGAGLDSAEKRGELEHPSPIPTVLTILTVLPELSQYHSVLPACSHFHVPFLLSAISYFSFRTPFLNPPVIELRVRMAGSPASHLEFPGFNLISATGQACAGEHFRLSDDRLLPHTF